MRHVTTAAGRPTTAQALDAAIRRRGFVPGTPARLRLYSRLAEVEVCRRMRCRCGRRGRDYRPYHDGGDGYRVVASCPACGSGQEV
jgi:hypothetical protein